ncbi:ATP-binding protein [Skermanella pratensis]|uniref:sensor histidine kinase n=1 Tax=Skermanella pratensis TaxID=2233999 RepID=UPI001787A5A0|nr:ATP-binding protein [Skermanella pratensis]
MTSALLSSNPPGQAFLTLAHDSYLVVLACLICLFSCYTSLTLLAQARGSGSPESGARPVLRRQDPRRPQQWAWCAAAASVAGCGAWATHFVAMLAWLPGVQVGYDLKLTTLSIIVAIIGMGLSFAVALSGREGGLRGGALAGAAIAAMHFIGMAAVHSPARLAHGSLEAAVSVALSIGLGMAAFRMVGRPGAARRCAGTLTLTAAICALHFTAMLGVTVEPYPSTAVPGNVIAPRSLAIAVAAVSMTIITFGLAGSILDQHLASRAEREARRLRRYVAELEATQRELRSTAHDLTRALEAAAAASQAKSLFLATMSHELRTPLNAVIGFAELMANESYGPLGDARYRDYSGIIRDSGSHLLNLINDVLDISKLDANRLELLDDTVDVRHLLADAVHMISGQVEKAELTLSCRPPPHGVRLKADARRIRQVLLNLLSNAVKFTPSGGSISVTAEPSGDGFEITVCDTGIGIASEDIPTAFERFGQVDNRFCRRYEGTGLGLPLAKRLMELHGGTLDLASVVGSGTRVSCRFPAERIVMLADAGS